MFAVTAMAGLATACHPLPASAQGESGDTVPAALATGSGPLETEIAAEIFVGEEAGRRDDDRRFVEARRVAAGEEVHYTIRVHNPGKAAVRDVVVTKRLPFGVDYVPGSAVGPASFIEVSIDGGGTFVKAQRVAGAPTHVRWTLQRPLPAGATVLLRFRATFR